MVNRLADKEMYVKSFHNCVNNFARHKEERSVINITSGFEKKVTSLQTSNAICWQNEGHTYIVYT